MERRKPDRNFAYETGDDMIEKKVKKTKIKHMVRDRECTKVHIKANKTDTGGNFYVFDEYDAYNNLLSLNRYVFKNSDEQFFEELTEEEELILNPPVVETEIEEMI